MEKMVEVGLRAIAIWEGQQVKRITGLPELGPFPLCPNSINVMVPIARDILVNTGTPCDIKVQLAIHLWVFLNRHSV